jgi:hypothetical protein
MNKQSPKQGTLISRDGSRTITVEEFDRLFDEGSDQIDAFLDWDNARRAGAAPKRVNVDFPPLMVRDLDAVASARGVTRQALIKMWLADKLDEHHTKTPKNAAE